MQPIGGAQRLNQQNFYQQQGYGSQQSLQGMQAHLQEQDLAHLILSELKRVAREYTTAVLEANNMQTRQTFQFLLQKTLHDQGILYEVIQQTVGYGDIPTAPQQDIQKELQKQSQSASQLYGFVQQNKFGSLGGQNQMQNQPQNQLQNQPQNQTFAFNQQPQGMSQQQTFQPSQSQSQSNSPLFPNGNYGPSSPINYTGPQTASSTKNNSTASESSASASFDNNETSSENAKSGQSINEGSKYSF
jgi:spore coat protein CotF